MDFQEPHFTELKCLYVDKFDPDRPGGKNWKTFVNKLSGVNGACLEPTALIGGLTRKKVFELAADGKRVATIDVCAAILAWGGMSMATDKSGRGLHHRFFEQAKHGWLEVAEDIRKGEVSRKEAYEFFRSLRSENRLRGVGPAYFTKLIYFLMPRGLDAEKQGYIMDPMGRMFDESFGR